MSEFIKKLLGLKPDSVSVTQKTMPRKAGNEPREETTGHTGQIEARTRFEYMDEAQARRSEQEIKTERRNFDMNIKEVNGLITNLRENLGEACISSAIISYETGSSIAEYQMEEKGAALLSKYTTFLVEMVGKAKEGASIEYYAIKLSQSMMAFTLIFKGYCWFTVVDTKIVPLGMIMNGVLPECISDFKELFE